MTMILTFLINSIDEEEAANESDQSAYKDKIDVHDYNIAHITNIRKTFIRMK